ncbi:MAG TPA: trigger factor [Tepidisphaeraceae bacterium]|jgi:trigger factor|nr:trigger factor [Tepidisphaeraceae bacterium]
MAEEQAAAEATPTAVQEQEQSPYQIKIEDAGPATKKVSVEVPQELIATKLEEQFKQLRREAAIPGFRPGHAPAKLIEKRFHNDVRDQVRRSVISESYEQAISKNSLTVIGEPQFDQAEEIKLPESGNLTYSFEVEVQPDFQLPPLTSLSVKKPKVEVKDEHLDQAMLNLRQQQGALVPVEDRGVEVGDYLVADVHLKVDGNEVVHQHDAQVIAKPGRFAGIQLDDLDVKLQGMKPGEKREFTVQVPDTHPDEKLKSKEATVEIALKDIKKMELAEINQQFLDGLGFTNEQELRDALREQMLHRVEYDVQQSMRDQINNYLLQNVYIDLPTKLSDRQAERVLKRRKMDLMMRGLPEDQVEAKIDELRGRVKEEAVRDLKLFFILQKIANDQNVDVDEAELNGRIATLAAQSGRRPEKLKQEMSADGSLLSMYVQMREQKALDKILATAKIEEVEMPAPGSAATNA